MDVPERVVIELRPLAALGQTGRHVASVLISGVIISALLATLAAYHPRPEPRAVAAASISVARAEVHTALRAPFVPYGTPEPRVASVARLLPMDVSAPAPVSQEEPVPVVAPVPAPVPPPAPTPVRHYPSAQEMRAVLTQEAIAFGQDPAIALAVMFCESTNDHSRIGAAGEIGALQFLPSTFYANARRAGIARPDVYDFRQQAHVAMFMWAGAGTPGNSQAYQWTCWRKVMNVEKP